MDHFRSLILRWFVPAELFAEAEVRRQAYRAVVFGLAMLIWVPVFAPIYLWMDSPRAAMLVGLVSIAIVLSICSLRFSKSVALAGNLLAGAVFAVLVGLACVSGGIAAASLWWLPSVPIIGLVICGVRSGMAWAIGSCVACVVFLTAALFGITLEDDISPEHHQLLDCAGACGIVLCAFILTFAFRRSEAEAREDLTIARDAAERANRAKSVFLENMSHEMRTPMNAIIGMTDLTLRSELRGTERGYLEVVRESSESLLALIDNILDYSKLDTSGFALAREPLDPRAVAVATIETFRSRADRRGLELACHVQADVPRLVVGDQKRLRQVLANLVDNAIKFTDRGRVALDVRCRKATDDGVDLSFSVSDTGIGIAADKQQVIFDLFEKADMSSTRLGDFIAARPSDGRRDRGGERAGARQHVPVHGLVWPRGSRVLGGRPARVPATGRRARAAPHPAGRGRPRQSETGGHRSGKGRPHGDCGEQRPRGAGGGGRPDLRSRPDGRPDARNGRPRGDSRHP